MKKQKSIHCPYCGGTAVLRDASFVYGKNSHGGHIYVCSHYPKCDSYVGVHEGTQLPKGTLADKELRKQRIQAHQIFDQLWRRDIFSRQDAYRWAAAKFGLSNSQAHIGLFGSYMCDQLILESQKILENHGFRFQAAG